MKLIGITGSSLDINGQHICSSNSGKDTLAIALSAQKQYQGYNVKVVALASTLVDIAVKSTGVKSIFFTSQKYKNHSLSKLDNKTPRQVLVDIGSDLRSQYGDDVLARALIARYADSDKLIIVPDVRTTAEVNCFRGIGSIFHVVKYTGMKRLAFLNSIGIKSLDDVTECALPYCLDDVQVSLDLSGNCARILYENPLQIAA